MAKKTFKDRIAPFLTLANAKAWAATDEKWTFVTDEIISAADIDYDPHGDNIERMVVIAENSLKKLLDDHLSPGAVPAKKELSYRSDGTIVETTVTLGDGTKVSGWYDVYRGKFIYFRHPHDMRRWLKVNFTAENPPYRVNDTIRGGWVEIDFRQEVAA